MGRALGLAPQYTARDPAEGCWTTTRDCEPERHTGGLAVGDVDRDGDLDLFVTRLDGPDRLLLNRGDGRFEDASVAWGIEGATASNGAAFVDVDRDGDLDLYVLTVAPPGAAPPNDRYLFYLQQDGRFVEDGAARGLDFADGAGRAGASVAVGDYDRDGWPDLHLSEWRSTDHAGQPTHERLLRNRGAAAPGHFEDVTERAGVFLGGPQCAEDGTACIARSFASAFRDLDDDGWPDLAVVADFGRSRLFWNQGDGTFADAGEDAGIGTDENGMGSSFADLDGDGRLDWFVTSIADDPVACAGEACGWGASGNRLYRNLGGRRFEDATDRFGLRAGGWGWGAALVDLDHDGDLDAVMTNGYDAHETEEDAHFVSDRARLWVGGAEPWHEVAARAGFDHVGQGRGLCAEDFDGDGDLDVVVADHGGDAHLFENRRGSERAWVRLRVEYADGSVAYGAGVDVAGQRRDVAARADFLCGSEPELHVGLGRRERVDVRVRWPDGRESVHALATRTRHVLRPP